MEIQIFFIHFSYIQMIAEFNSYMSNIDIDFFKELCLKHGELRHYKKNEFILHEGDACSFFGFEAEDLSVLVDDRNEKIGRKIRDTELKRIPYMLIVGEKEAENNEVSVRKQGEGDKGSMKITTFAALLKGEVEDQMNHWKKDNN